jgi:hypothetical protein
MTSASKRPSNQICRRTVETFGATHQGQARGVLLPRWRRRFRVIPRAHGPLLIAPFAKVLLGWRASCRVEPRRSANEPPSYCSPAWRAGSWLHVLRQTRQFAEASCRRPGRSMQTCSVGAHNRLPFFGDIEMTMVISKLTRKAPGTNTAAGARCDVAPAAHVRSHDQRAESGGVNSTNSTRSSPST